MSCMFVSHLAPVTRWSVYIYVPPLIPRRNNEGCESVPNHCSICWFSRTNCEDPGYDFWRTSVQSLVISTMQLSQSHVTQPTLAQLETFVYTGQGGPPPPYPKAVCTPTPTNNLIESSSPKTESRLKYMKYVTVPCAPLSL